MIVAAYAFLVQAGIDFVVSAVLLVLSLWAVGIAARASERAYVVAMKRTKGFWCVLMALSVLVSLMAAYSDWRALAVGLPHSGGQLLQLMAAVAVGVFLADVRPAVQARRRR